MKNLIALILSGLLWAGCATTYKGAVTITATVDAGMKGWAELSVSGKTTPALDAQVKQAHAKYRMACTAAANALVAYKAGGDQAHYVLLLEAARASAGDIFDLILPLFTGDKQLELETKLRTASTL